MTSNTTRSVRATGALREFHVSRKVREAYGLDESLISLSGNVVFADNHIEQLQSFYPAQTFYQSGGGVSPQRDNIYNYEFAGEKAAADSWLVISTVASTDDTWVEEKYDKLDH